MFCFQVSGISHNVTTTADGEFWRLLVDGTFTYTVHAFGYDSSAPNSIVVKNSVGGGVKAKEMTEVRLKKREVAKATSDDAVQKAKEPKSDAVTLRPDGFLRKPEFSYHDYEDLRVVNGLVRVMARCTKVTKQAFSKISWRD